MKSAFRGVESAQSAAIWISDLFLLARLDDWVGAERLHKVTEIIRGPARLERPTFIQFLQLNHCDAQS
jgi:hypothetical protein